MLSPLQLDAYHLEGLQIDVSAKQPSPADEQASLNETYALRLKTDVKKDQDSLRFMVLLGVDLRRVPRTRPTQFTRIRIEVRGYFSLPEDTSDDLVQQLVPFNCFAILYGIARGIVSQATGITVCGSYLLPPINIIEALREKALEDE